MTAFDYAVLGIVGLSLLLGIGRGVIGEVFALGIWFLAFLATMSLHSPIAILLNIWISDPALQKAVAMIVIVLFVLLAGTAVRILIVGLVAAAGLSLVDRLLGGLFGLVRGIFVAMVLVMLGGMSILPREPWWKEAAFSPPLQTMAVAAKGYLPQELSSRIRFH